MGQSGPGNTPEVGRPRGAVWRSLVSEGIAWEGQVTIAGEHSDLAARLIVTGQRVVFVRNGAIALDAERAWLDPAPTMGRNGRVSLAISTPNGNGPIPVEIRVRDGKFGATRLISKLTVPPGGDGSPFSAPPPRQRSPERTPRPEGFGAAPPAATPGQRPASRSGQQPTRPESRPAVPPVPTEPLMAATAGFGIPASGLPPVSTPMPSFGVAAPPPGRATRSGNSRSTASPVDRAGDHGLTETSSPLSVAAVNRAFGDRPATPDSPSRPTSGASTPPKNAGESPTRWTLASELLARSGPTETARPGISASTLANAPIPQAPTQPAATTTGNLPALSAGTPEPTSSATSRGLAIPSSLRRSDPVPHARPLESPGSRSMLPGLPAGTPPSDPASDRHPISAAPSGRLAGNSVITARSSAAARQSAKQGGAAKIRPDELSPTAVALASARAGVPLAPLPGPVPVGDIPVMAEGSDERARRGFFGRLAGGRVSPRAAWGITAFALVVLTVAAGLYLALGIPTDDGNGGDGNRSAGLTQPPASGSAQVAIVAATPSATTRTVPTPTATNAIPRGVGGQSNGVTVPTRAATAPESTDGTDGADPAATDPAQGASGDGVTAPEDDIVETDVVPSSVPSASPSKSAAPTATTVPTAAPTVEPTATATTEPTVAPTETAAPTAEPTATATTEPTATKEPTSEPTVAATEEPTAEPPATVEPTATTEPTAEPTATQKPSPTATNAPTPTPGPDVEPQPATVDDDGVPSQVFAVGSVRYTIESVEAGPTIPEINQPQSPFGGDWLAVVLTAENWGEGDAVIDMTEFTASIGSSGETDRLDTYSETVAIQLGFPQVIGAVDQVAVAPGDEIRLGLLYLTAQGASGFVLNAGTATVDLTAAFNSSIPMNQLGEEPVAPDLLEATVVGVIDAVTIEVEIDGEKVPVRYTGMVAPDIESCFSGSSTLANRDLVMGQTVWLERQNANVDTDGTWLRDVWIESDSGSLELVSAALAADGVIDAVVERPNSRYAAYLETLAFIAETNGTGIWAGCGAD